MAQKPTELTGEQLVFAYLAEYLDDDLPSSIRESYIDSLKKVDPKETLPEQFKDARGRMQLALQDFALNEQQIRGLHVLVEDDATRAAKEAVESERMERSETWGQVGRWFGYVAVFGLIAGVMFWYFRPPEKAKFNALETLVYEALSMEEDPELKLDLPSSDFKEIRDFVANYPGLDFAPIDMSYPPASWNVMGGSVLDYDVAKIITVQFSHATHAEEKLFLFMFKGHLSQLPKAEKADFEGFEYQTYSSEQINVIAWQGKPDTVALLIGHRNAQDLAKAAKALN